MFCKKLIYNSNYAYIISFINYFENKLFFIENVQNNFNITKSKWKNAIDILNRMI